MVRWGWVLAALMLIAGCGAAKPAMPFSGEWKISQTDAHADKMRREGRPDRLNFIIGLKDDGTYQIMVSGRHVIESGKWTVGGDDITLTPDYVELDGPLDPHTGQMTPDRNTLAYRGLTLLRFQ